MKVTQVSTIITSTGIYRLDIGDIVVHSSSSPDKCPKCGSIDIEPVSQPNLSKVMHCKRCNNNWLAQP